MQKCICSVLACCILFYCTAHSFGREKNYTLDVQLEQVLASQNGKNIIANIQHKDFSEIAIYNTSNLEKKTASRCFDSFVVALTFKEVNVSLLCITGDGAIYTLSAIDLSVLSAYFLGFSITNATIRNDRSIFVYNSNTLRKLKYCEYHNFYSWDFTLLRTSSLFDIDDLSDNIAYCFSRGHLELPTNDSRTVAFANKRGLICNDGITCQHANNVSDILMIGSSKYILINYVFFRDRNFEVFDVKTKRFAFDVSIANVAFDKFLFLPKSETLLATTFDGSVYFFDSSFRIVSKRRIFTFQISSVYYSLSNDSIYFSSRDGRITVLEKSDLPGSIFK